MQCRMECQTENMNRFLKTLLLWLLLVALPFQGIAATMQTVCGPMENNGPKGITISAHVHHHDDEAMDLSHADTAHHGAAMKSVTSSDPSPDAKHAHSACSMCASCCVGAVAPPSALNPNAAYSKSLPAVASPTPLVTGVVPRGLERPPKRITA